MSRKSARIQALEQIFQTMFHEDGELLVSEDLTAEDRAYTLAVVGGVAAHREELSQLIAQNAKGYELSRLYKVDLAIMLIAAYEIKYASELEILGIKDINKAIACSEAVSLAKKYSTVKSPSFINGILAKID